MSTAGAASVLDDRVAAVLRGAIESHVHSAPDVVPRHCDDLELVADAAAAGLRALVMKSHAASTAERAYLLNRVQPDVTVIGGVTLNAPVGGLNPAAVEAALACGARQVWMPTKSAANHRRFFGEPGGLTVLDRDGLRQEVREILQLAASADAVVATGHLSARESQVLIAEALRCGVRRISVTHPEWAVTAMPVDVQRALAETGVVYFERCLVSTEPAQAGSVPFETIVSQIRAVGCDTTIVATDYGLPQYGRPIDGLRRYVARLFEAGFDEGALSLMLRVNPWLLLGLET